MISEAILISKTYARLQKIASNFSKKIWGEARRPHRRSRFRRSVRGFAPLPGSPFQNLGSAPAYYRFYSSSSKLLDSGSPSDLSKVASEFSLAGTQYSASQGLITLRQINLIAL